MSVWRGAARRDATRRGALRVVAEGWMMRANSRGVIFQARLYRLWLSAIRPAVSNAWPNERSVWCDWSGYRIIFRIPLRAPFFARHKASHFGNQRWPFRIVMFIKLISIRLQDNIFIYAKDELNVVLWFRHTLDSWYLNLQFDAFVYFYILSFIYLSSKYIIKNSYIYLNKLFKHTYRYFTSRFIIEKTSWHFVRIKFFKNRERNSHWRVKSR